MGTATILHVDDEISFVKDLREDLVAMGVEESQQVQALSLNMLEQKLKGYQSFAIVILDGKFPETPGGLIRFNGRRAYDLVTAHSPDANIVVYSGEDGGVLDGHFRDIPVHIIQKGFGSHETLKDWIKAELIRLSV